MRYTAAPVWRDIGLYVVRECQFHGEAHRTYLFDQLRQVTQTGRRLIRRLLIA